MSTITSTTPPPTYVNTGTTTETQATNRSLGVGDGVQSRASKLPEAERKLFLELAAILVPTSGLTNEQKTALLDKIEGAAKLLTGAAVIEIADVLARALIEQAAAKRQNALQDAMNMRLMAKGELMEQAAKMREAAVAMIVGAALSLAVAVAGAVVTIASTVKSFKSQAGDIQGLKDSNTGLNTAFKNGDQAAIGKYQSNISAHTSLMGAAGTSAVIGQAIGQLIQQVSQTIQGLTQAAGKILDAEGMVHAAKSEDYKALAEYAKAMYEKLDELIKTLIAFLRDMAENEVELMRSASKV